MSEKKKKTRFRGSFLGHHVHVATKFSQFIGDCECICAGAVATFHFALAVLAVIIHNLRERQVLHT